MDNTERRTYFFKIDATNKKIRNALQKRFDQAGLDLTVDQWAVLNHAFQNPAINQQALGELVYKDAATLTRILDLLVKKGFVVRQMAAEDRRKFNIVVTEAGATIYHQAYEVVVVVRRLGWASLSDEDYERFTMILDRIFDNFNA